MKHCMIERPDNSEDQPDDVKLERENLKIPKSKNPFEFKRAQSRLVLQIISLSRIHISVFTYSVFDLQTSFKRKRSLRESARFEVGLNPIHFALCTEPDGFNGSALEVL